ncbi:MAG TPA: hypothetical protein VE988_21365 [Gemmataceae bacterium]|nr:hypothetical protein [Gemmataceae bacterium]
MGKLIRRFWVIAALMFWQGGFTFYAAVVVPIGADVLGSHLAQGFVTRQVTIYLNLAGAVSLPILALDIAATTDATRWRPRARWALCGVLLVTLLVQCWLHYRLDDLLDPAARRHLDKPTYLALHAVYLHVSTSQWIAALAGLVLSLAAWRAEDGEIKVSA